MKSALKVVGVLFGLLVLAAVVAPKSPSGTTATTAAPTSITDSRTAAATATVASSAVATVVRTPTPTPAPTAFSFGDGTYTVPTQIAPGTYRTRDKQSGSCYWTRLSGFGGSLGEILSNDLTSDPTVVTIVETDKGFQSRGCARFSADISAITKAPTDPLPAGVYIVGVDVAPGTWSATPPTGGSCYWTRLSAFTGGTNSIIANDLPRGPTIVTIAATDKGFSSKGCGTWTKT
jgi:hypothetical protein